MQDQLRGRTEYRVAGPVRACVNTNATTMSGQTKPSTHQDKAPGREHLGVRVPEKQDRFRPQRRAQADEQEQDDADRAAV